MKIGIIASKMSNVLIKCRVHWSPEMVEQVMLGMDFQLSWRISGSRSDGQLSSLSAVCLSECSGHEAGCLG